MRKNISVLVVDDDKDIRDILGIIFEMDGHAVRFAGSYNEALALVESEHFDLVITDYRMPRMHGLYLLEMIKDVRPALPVIIMTAYHTEKMEQEARRKRVDGLICKGFTYDELMALVTNVIERND